MPTEIQYPLPGSNDSTTLQAVIDLMQASGITSGTIVLQGDYTLASTLNITSTPGISIEGRNANVTGPSGTYAIDVDATSKVRISGIRFTATGTTADAILIDDSSDCMIENCFFSGYTNAGVATSGITNNLSISGESASVNTMTIEVAASGDTTGATDHANIEAAIAQLESQTPSGSRGAVILTGKNYYLDDVLELGSYAELSGGSWENYIPPSIISRSNSYLTYTGTSTSSYFISIYSSSWVDGVRLGNLHLDCNANCRGIRLQQQSYMTSIENIVVYDAIEVGADIVDCWKGYIKDLHLRDCDGIALRVHTGNQLVIDNARIYNTDDSTFPSTSDTTVADYNGATSYVQTPTANRAALVINDARSVVFRNLMFESNNSSTLPLVHIEESCYDIHFLESLYFENDACQGAYILIDGKTTPSSLTKNFTFQNIRIRPSYADIKSIIRTSGQVSNLHVDGVVGDQCDAIVTAIGGTLRDSTVKNVRLVTTSDSGSMALPTGRHFVESGGVCRVNNLQWGTVAAKFYDADDSVIAATRPLIWMDAADLSATGDGTAVTADWQNRSNLREDFTVAGAPTWEEDAFGGGLPGVRFDGTNDYFVYTGELIPRTAQGTMMFVAQSSTLGTNQYVLSASDLVDTAPTEFVYFGIDSSSPAQMKWYLRDPGVTHITSATTTTAVDTPLIAMMRSDESNYRAQVNGVHQALSFTSGTDDGSWTDEFDGTNSTGNCVIGALQQGSGPSTTSYFHGDIAVVLYWNRALSWDEIKSVTDILKTRYGLGTNLSNIAGNIELDSDNAIIFGGEATDGSWRLVRSGDDLEVQTLVSGSWVTKDYLANCSHAVMVDASGETDSTDYDNIMAAVSTLATKFGSGGNKGAIILTGNSYDLTSTLTLTSDPPAIISPHGCYIEYTGAQTSSYMISMTDKPGLGYIRLKNLYLDCNSNCRGVLFHTQSYFAAIENVHVIGSYEIGIDVVDCYKGVVRDCHVQSGRGIGVRIHTGNQLVVDNLRIAGMTDADWPSTSDTSVQDYATDYVQTAADERAALVIDDARSIVFRDAMFENMNYTTKPNIYIAEDAYDIHFKNSMYFENNDNQLEYVKIDAENNSTSYCKLYTFENVRIQSAYDTVETFIRTDGYVSNVVVDGIWGTLMATIIKVDSGFLYDSEVKRMRMGHEGLAVNPAGAIIENGGYARDYLIFGRESTNIYDADEAYIAKTRPIIWLEAEDLSATGDGSAVVTDWENRGHLQEDFVVNSAPTYEADALGTGMPGIRFDGTDDYFKYSSELLVRSGRGTFIGVGQTDTLGTLQHFLSAAETVNTSSNANFITFGVDDTAGTSKIRFAIKATNTTTLTSGATISASTPFIYVMASDGANYHGFKGLTRQTLTASPGSLDGDWSDELNSTNKTDNCVIGALFRGSDLVESSFWSGDIATVLYWSRTLAWTEIRSIVEILQLKYNIT
jgi:hypothetical protein